MEWNPALDEASYEKKSSFNSSMCLMCSTNWIMSYLYHTVEYPSIRCDVILERRMEVDYQKRRAKKKFGSIIWLQLDWFSEY